MYIYIYIYIYINKANTLHTTACVSCSNVTNG